MVSKNSARDALAASAFLRPKVGAQIEQPGTSAENVVQLNTEPAMAAAGLETASSTLNQQPGRAANPSKGTVAATAKRVMLYLPPKAKKKFREIAFHEDRKDHDVFMEALREYLEKRGHKGIL
jgi:hypothetical protein